MSEDYFELGLSIRKEVTGAERVEKVMAAVDDFDRDFQKFVTEYAFGRIWGDKTLSHKQRSLNNLCILGTMGRMPQFEVHFRGALRNGCTRDEIRATLTQIMGYVGFPAGAECFRVARRVLREMDQADG